VLEGARPAFDVPVAALVDDSMGMQAYMRVDALRRLLREGGTVSGAALQVDPASLEALNAELKQLPAVAGVAVRDATLRSFRQTMAEHMTLIIFFNVFFSGVIAFGVVYNAARVSLSERSVSWPACVSWASGAPVALIPARRARAVDAGIAARRGGHRVRPRRVHHDHLHQRGVPAAVRRDAADGGVDVPDRDCIGRPPRWPFVAIGSTRPRGCVEIPR
jgi:hypothetical protein